MKHVVTGAPARQIVLVTGFGGFPGNRSNPTVAILRELERQRPRLTRLGISLHCVLLPVVYAEIDGALGRAVDAHRPHAILHLGLAARRRAISVETRAINRADPLHPDAQRRRPTSQVLSGGGPDRLAATYPSARILAALGRHGVPAHRSIDAGDYVCNATLYRSLFDGRAAQAGFLHVPRPRDPAQPCARTRQSKPAADALTRAALVAILTMARRH